MLAPVCRANQRRVRKAELEVEGLMAWTGKPIVAPTAGEAAAIAVITASNIAINRAGSRSRAILAALGATGCMLLLAKAAGAAAVEQGLDIRTARQGLFTGLVAGIPVAAGMALGAHLPWARRFFQDERIVGADMSGVAYELFVRIPIVTAAGEELVFRSALEGVLSQRRSPARASLASAALFGAWHILPTLDRVHSNPGAASAHQGSLLRKAAIVALVCTATAAASLGLSWLRRRTGSILAPVVVHYAVNAGGFAGGWLSARQRALWEEKRS